MTKTTRQTEMEAYLTLTMEVEALGRRIIDADRRGHEEGALALIAKHIETNDRRIAIMAKLNLIPAGN
jgi:hypothetical protein